MNGRLNTTAGGDTASAANLTLPDTGNFIRITGAIACDYIDTTRWIEGASFDLYIVDGATITHNAAAPPVGFGKIFCDGSVNIAAAAGSVVRFIFDGVNFLARVVFTP